MSLANLTVVTATISSLSATVSLIYVGIQTRQSVRHTRAQIHQAVAARTSSLLLGMMSAEAAAVWIEGNGGVPTPELVRRQQFDYQCGMLMVAMEDYFGQHEAGLLSDEQFSRGCVTFRDRLTAPGFRAYWLKQRASMLEAAPRYCAFIDGLCEGGAGIRA